MYVCKLKKPAAVLLAMGASDSEIAVACDGQQWADAAGVDAATINTETWEAVRATLPDSVAQHVEHGRSLQFLPDTYVAMCALQSRWTAACIRDASVGVASPVEWIRDRPVTVEDAAPGVVSVQASCLGTPVARHGSYGRGPGCFAGNHYLKLLSAGWLAEWAYTHSLHSQQLPMPSYQKKAM